MIEIRVVLEEIRKEERARAEVLTFKTVEGELRQKVELPIGLWRGRVNERYYIKVLKSKSINEKTLILLSGYIWSIKKEKNHIRIEINFHGLWGVLQVSEEIKELREGDKVYLSVEKE